PRDPLEVELAELERPPDVLARLLEYVALAHEGVGRRAQEGLAIHAGAREERVVDVQERSVARVHEDHVRARVVDDAELIADRARLLERLARGVARAEELDAARRGGDELLEQRDLVGVERLLTRHIDVDVADHLAAD